MRRGEELFVLLDHRPAVPDIRRNAEELGHEVLLTREPEPGVWEMHLRRGGRAPVRSWRCSRWSFWRAGCSPGRARAAPDGWTRRGRWRRSRCGSTLGI